MRIRAFIFLSAAAIIALGLLVPTAGGGEQPPMIRFEWQGRRLEGLTMQWSREKGYLLGRDGCLWTVNPRQINSIVKSSPRFRPYNAGEIRTSLMREFGERYEVTGTGHFFVVHPVGDGAYWSPRFEALYRAFVGYFSVRGLELGKPQFPLIGVVLPDQQTFFRHAASEGSRISSNTLGYYSIRTNRVCLYNLGGAAADPERWVENADTLIHEAAHQTAFNTGLHSRFGDNPTWVVEGLGTMFEARGVWNSGTFTQQVDRLNRGRLRDFRQFMARGRPSGLLETSIGTNRLFELDVGAGYAEAWAFSFFLCETRPEQYGEYLAKLGTLPPFVEYTARQRIADFNQIFQTDLRLLEQQFLDFMADLR